MMDTLRAALPTPAEITWMLSTSARAALLLATSWLAATMLRRSAAAARHQAWALGVVGALVMPLLCRIWAGVSTLAGTAGAALVATALQVTGSATAPAPSWLPWLTLPWSLGALLVAIRVLRGHLAARRLWRSARPVSDGAWWSALHETATALGVRRAVGLGRSDLVRSPMTLGLLWPRVLLPATVEGWSPERIRAVLTHELGHVRRHDALLQLCAQLVCALYWWNPLAWLAAARLRVEREHACDDLVLSTGVRPSRYAAELLELARAVSLDQPAGVDAACMADLSGTEARLRRILDPAASRRSPAWTSGLARAVAVGLVLALAGSSTPLARASAVSVGEPRVQDWGLDGPAPPPALTLEVPFDLSLIQAEVRRHLPDLERCFARRLLASPALSGQVVIHWSVQPDGEVGEQCITEDTVGDPELLACVNALVASSHFPATGGGAVSVEFPFQFVGAPGALAP